MGNLNHGNDGNDGAVGAGSLALGVNATALDEGAAAVGRNSTAVGAQSVTFGADSNALGQEGTALGGNAFTLGRGASAVGFSASAVGNYSFAGGYGAASNGTVSVGADNDWTDAAGVVHAAFDRQITNVAAGTEATDAVNKSQLDAVAGAVEGVVTGAVTYDDEGKARITLAGSGGTVIGNVAPGAVAAGSTEAVNGDQLYATHARVGAVEGRVDTLETRVGDVAGTLANAVTYDNDSHDAISLSGPAGTRLGNVQAGTAGMDAVNVNQLAALASAFGEEMGFNGGTFTGPKFTFQGAGYTTVRSTFDEIDVAFGAIEARVSTLEQAASQSSVPMGTGDGLAVGNDSHAAGISDTAIGSGAKVDADGSTALGANSSIAATATNSVAVGADSSISAANGTALGQGASVTADNAVALGQGSVADEANTVSVGSAQNERKLTHVAAGSAPTDAANVQQLQAGDTQSVAAANA